MTEEFGVLVPRPHSLVARSTDPSPPARELTAEEQWVYRHGLARSARQEVQFELARRGVRIQGEVDRLAKAEFDKTLAAIDASTPRINDPSLRAIGMTFNHHLAKQDAQSLLGLARTTAYKID